MHFNVTHRTVYSYDRAIFLEPHTFRLQPRSDATQRLLSYSLELAPEPAGRSSQVDGEGDSTILAWFNGTHDSFAICSTFEVETLRANPFDYLPTPGAETLPVPYPDRFGGVLRAYQERRLPTPEVDALSAALADEANHRVQPFLDLLMRRLFEQSHVVIREEGDPKPASVTLATREGSCRDLSVLFVDCCRARGLAARFASGYQQGDHGQENRYMHAWAEVYVPGGGWRGYDPTLCLAVADRHVVVATGAEPAAAAPFEGNFRGTGAQSTMLATIDMLVTD